MGEKVNLNAVQSFVDVVALGSVSAAAKKRGVTVANLSRKMSTLEKDLGMPLFDKRGGNLQLTEQGQLLWQAWSPIAGQIDAALDTMQTEQHELHGVLQVVLPAEIGPRLVGSAMVSFVQQHPALEVQCMTSLQGTAFQPHVDVAIWLGRGLQADSPYVVRQLGQLHSKVVAAPSLLARTGCPRLLTDLATSPCITTSEELEGTPWTFILPSGELESPAIERCFRVDSGQLAKEAALAGVGFAVLLEQDCAAHIEAGELVVVELDASPAPLDIYVAYAHRQLVPRKVRVFVEHLTDSLRVDLIPKDNPGNTSSLKPSKSTGSTGKK
ncbi:LysR family transcriptional regulator [Paenalcaligenes sp. Me131]|uniref:LysR family transcriptional regulator n=1 Tax=Paenalcaligenes sp. Me131 TaxID=3392636 RepID=UPI003D2E39AE